MKNLLIPGLIVLQILIIIILILNFFVRFTTRKQITSEDNLPKDGSYDCILILGAAVWGDSPSPMLKDRLETGISLYKNGYAKKIIMSGDHGKDNYDEVNLMKNYAMQRGVPSEDIFMDHAGFSTYESIYRAKEIFGVKKLIIVSQKYHLYRAIYIANQLGLDSYGVDATKRKYGKEIYREVREVIARDKDLIKCIFKPEPTYLGDSIPVSGNGNVTNDK